MIKKCNIITLFSIVFIISCSSNTTPVRSNYIVTEDSPLQSSSSFRPPIINDEDSNKPNIPSNLKEYTIENVSTTTKVLVNANNFFEKNNDLEKYHRMLVGNKKVIDKDTREERYRFDNNLNIVKYNMSGNNIIYKKYIKAVLVRMKDEGFKLNGKYAVGGIYKVEKKDKKVITTDKYEIIVYNNFRHYNIDGQGCYVVSIFNIPSYDINEKYNPENVYNGIYTFTHNSYLKWTLVPIDF